MIFTALQSGDKVGLLVNNGECSRYIPPKKGRHHKQEVLRCVWTPLTQQKRHLESNFIDSLEELSYHMTKRGFLCFISDFLQPEVIASETNTNSEKLLAVLRKLSYRHETLALRTFDPRERHLPNVGTIVLRDQESGRTVKVNTSHSDWKHKFQSKWEQWNTQFSELMKKTRWDFQDFQTDIDPLPLLANFLGSRTRR